jgi:hypothetical protein
MKIKSKAFKSISKLAKKKLTVAKKLASPPGLQKLLKKQSPAKLVGPLLNKLSKQPGLLKNEKFLGIVKDLVANSPNRAALKRLAQELGARRPSGSTTASPASPRFGIPERDFGQRRPGSTLGNEPRFGIPERDFGQRRPGSVLKDPLVVLFAARQAQLP